MKKYYLYRSDGSQVFLLPYSEDFIYHCLILLLDRTPYERYYLLDVSSLALMSVSVTCAGRIILSAVAHLDL